MEDVLAFCVCWPSGCAGLLGVLAFWVCWPSGCSMGTTRLSGAPGTQGHLSALDTTIDIRAWAHYATKYGEVFCFNNK